MQFVLILRQLERRRVLLALGVFLSAAAAFLGAHKLAAPQLTWTSSSQVFVDSGSSAIANSTVALDALGERAGAYANMMTSSGVLEYVAKASGIPANEIAVTGPVGETGLRAKRAPSAPGGPYSLTLDVTAPQPIIDISATAPTRRNAIALANGAAQGLAKYVRQLVVSERIPVGRDVSIRQLGPANANSSTSGLSSVFILPLALVAFCAWCMLVQFADRFIETWRASAEFPVTTIAAGSQQAAALPYWGEPNGGNEAYPEGVNREDMEGDWMVALDGGYVETDGEQLDAGSDELSDTSSQTDGSDGDITQPAGPWADVPDVKELTPSRVSRWRIRSTT